MIINELGSAVCTLHTGEVAGSIPAAPTSFHQQYQYLADRAFPFPPWQERERTRKIASRLGEIWGTEWLFVRATFLWGTLQ